MSLLLLFMCAVQVEAVQRHHQDVSENSAGANLWFTGAKVSCAVSFSHPPTPPLPTSSLPSPLFPPPLLPSLPSPPLPLRRISLMWGLCEKKRRRRNTSVIMWLQMSLDHLLYSAVFLYLSQTGVDTGPGTGGPLLRGIHDWGQGGVDHHAAGWKPSQLHGPHRPS